MLIVQKGFWSLLRKITLSRSFKPNKKWSEKNLLLVSYIRSCQFLGVPTCENWELTMGNPHVNGPTSTFGNDKCWLVEKGMGDASHPFGVVQSGRSSHSS